MKYLFMIVRHFFPRRRWRQVEEVVVYATDFGGNRLGKEPMCRIRILGDQFGNLKKFKI